MNFRAYLVFPLMALLVILQSAVLPRFSIMGVVPQLMFLAVVAWGLLHGLREGIFWAFVAGVFVDLFSATPIGTSALAMMAAVSAAILLQKNLPGNRVITTALLAAFATLVFWFVYLLLLRILIPFYLNNLPFLGLAYLEGSSKVSGLVNDISSNYSFGGAHLRYILSTTLVHGLLILPIYWAFITLERIVGPRRVEI